MNYENGYARSEVQTLPESSRRPRPVLVCFVLRAAARERL